MTVTVSLYFQHDIDDFISISSPEEHAFLSKNVSIPAVGKTKPGWDGTDGECDIVIHPDPPQLLPSLQ